MVVGSAIFQNQNFGQRGRRRGKVEYNGQRCKPGKTVDLGAELSIRQGWFDKVVIVKGLSDRRQNASIAETLYQETEESRVRREEKLEQRRAERESLPMPFRRPNKRDRRLIHRFREKQSD